MKKAAAELNQPHDKLSYPMVKIGTSVYLNIVFSEKPHWKMQKRGFYQNTLDFPKLPLKNNREFPTILKHFFREKC